MRRIWQRLRRKKREPVVSGLSKAEIDRYVDALFGVLSDMYGAERLILKAGKLDALELMRARQVERRVLALQRIVYEDPTLTELPASNQIPHILDELHERLAEEMARQAVEEEIERRVARKMQERHEEYVRDLRNQVLKENAGPDNAQTLKKYAELEIKEQVRLSRSAFAALRPASVDEVVGQDDAIQALFAKIASPYPQHVILYGPPGVGKTTVARLALEHAKSLPYTPFGPDAPFVEVDGSTLRWDPREVTNPLLGSVHDPIYQGARRDLADAAVPEPKPGLVTEAHGGVLFIDEIGELEPLLQNKLLKVLEDKRVRFESAYYDPDDENVPKYIKKLFEDGAPADFILIGATTRDPEEINPALRSRCAEVFFDPLFASEIELIVRNAARKISVALDENVPSLISQYTREGRRAVALLADAYGLALSEATDTGRQEKKASPPNVRITERHVRKIAQISRLTPYAAVVVSDKPDVGRVLGLGVHGFVGTVLEIEAVAFRASSAGKGTIRFNQTAGSMTQDSVFNAASVVRRVTGEDLTNWDVHVNVVGGGRIDGPSAGAAVVLAIISALWNRPVRQNVAITGEISIQGRVKAVGGVHEKVHGAVQAGITEVVVPKDNAMEAPELPGLKVHPVSRIEEAIDILFPGGLSLSQDLAPGSITPVLKRGMSS